jgi:TolB protein
VEEDADWSPDGTRIVFERSYDCATELKVCGGLWVVTADGRAERRLTPENPHGVTSELSPTWSPDGHTIAYELWNDRSERLDIWVMNRDGSDTRRLTHLGDAEEPAWAPDGRRIAFSHARDIFVLELNTDSLRRITRTPVDDRYPDWSPDGERIAYEVSDDNGYDAYVVNADGTHARRISQPDVTDGHPVWSPRGRFVAYTSDSLTGLAIVIVEADTGRRVRRIQPPGMYLYPIDWTGD